MKLANLIWNEQMPRQTFTLNTNLCQLYYDIYTCSVLRNGGAFSFRLILGAHFCVLFACIYQFVPDFCTNELSTILTNDNKSSPKRTKTQETNVWKWERTHKSKCKKLEAERSKFEGNNGIRWKYHFQYISIIHNIKCMHKFYDCLIHIWRPLKFCRTWGSPEHTAHITVKTKRN